MPCPTELLLLFMVYRRIVRFQFYDAEIIRPFFLHGIAQGADKPDTAVLLVGHVLGRQWRSQRLHWYGSGRDDAQVVNVRQRLNARISCCKNAFSSSAWGSPVTTGSKCIVAIRPSCTSRSRSMRSMTSWLCMTSSLESISRWKLTNRLPGP